MRHGAFDGIGRVISGRIPGVGLNANGRAQSRRLAERLADRTVSALFTSPLQRAMDTASILAQALSVPLHTEADLREVDFGAWTDHAIDDLAGDTAWTAFNQQRTTTRIPGGELMFEVQGRAVSSLIRIAASHPGGTVAVVSHADVIRAILVGCLGCGLDAMLRIAIDPSSVTEISLGEHPAVILRVNDTAHLGTASADSRR